MLMKLQMFEIDGVDKPTVIPDLASERLVRRSSKSEGGSEAENVGNPCLGLG